MTSSIEARLDSEPHPWKPEAGDRLVGTVVDLGERDSQFGGVYPMVTILTDGGEEFVVHGYHTVLKGELAQQRPAAGDHIGIAYMGRDQEKGYEKYRVIVEHMAPVSSPNWEQHGADAAREISGDDGSLGL